MCTGVFDIQGEELQFVQFPQHRAVEFAGTRHVTSTRPARKTQAAR
jgi:hypothetical protein